MTSKPLLIFDCDGVLVDSEPISLSVLCEALATEGLAIDDDMARDRFLGCSLASIIATVERDFGCRIGPDFLERQRARLYQRFRAELQPVPGIAEIWHWLAETRRDWCVASSSQPERIRLSLEIIGLLPAFSPSLFSATMVENGKPAPDLFLYAASGMKYDPEDCIVIEDSPAGIQAAQAAGMRVFAYLGGSHARDAAYRERIAAMNPDHVFDAMGDLVHLVEK